ncbi:MAG: carboxypeptidase regulatory-like domain-containing protein, partial [Terracidiphilus sp.]
MTGTVTDPAGAVISNASVTLTNVATNEVRAGKSNGSGIYDFAGLNHGTYTLKVEAKGFEKYVKTGIVMNVAATVQENAVLTIGTSNQTVTVEADALHLQTETNEISNLITGSQITELATNGRSITSLATLGTGVSGTLPEFNGTSAQGSSATISFNGMRTGHNDFLVDGGEIYDRGSGGKLGVMPSPDAIAEFQVLASNYSPDYGIASGGTTTIVLKSGTKDFHGGVWEFNRNDDFDALNWFTKQAAAQNHTAPAIPELRLNIYGGNVGGPLFIPVIYPKEKSKTFFFWTEEWRKMIQGSPANLTNAPTAAEIPTVADETSAGGFTYVPPVGLAESPGNNPLGNAVCAAGQKAPCVPYTTDPKYVDPLTGLYKIDNLTIGNSFPASTTVAGGFVIPGNLLDTNAVLFMGTGAIPASNTTAPNGSPVVIASPKQPTYVREDVVRIDHDFTSKMHLMGHWIHDQMSQTYFPNQNWGDGDSYTTAGDTMANPSWGSV